MVKTWAEKEMRNLLRMKAAGLNVPLPTMLRLHVLTMEFVGTDGWAAPRLKVRLPSPPKPIDLCCGKQQAFQQEPPLGASTT